MICYYVTSQSKANAINIEKYHYPTDSKCVSRMSKTT